MHVEGRMQGFNEQVVGTLCAPNQPWFRIVKVAGSASHIELQWAPKGPVKGFTSRRRQKRRQHIELHRNARRSSRPCSPGFVPSDLRA